MTKTTKRKAYQKSDTYKKATRAELLDVLTAMTRVGSTGELRLVVRVDRFLRDEIPPHVRASIISGVHGRAKDCLTQQAVEAERLSESAMRVPVTEQEPDGEPMSEEERADFLRSLTGDQKAEARRYCESVKAEILKRYRP